MAIKFSRVRVLELAGSETSLSLQGSGRRTQPKSRIIVDGQFTSGEDWMVTGSCRDAWSRPVDLSGGVVEMRISGPSGIVDVLCETVDADAGLYRASVPGLPVGTYQYEVRVRLFDSRTSVQNLGTVTVVPSLFDGG